MLTRRLGRMPRSHNAAIPSAHQICRAGYQAPIPTSKNWLTGMPPSLGMMLNDQLGNCTCAAFFHTIQLWSFNTTGTALTEPDNYVLDLYEAVGHYVPGNPDTDNGAVEQEVLSYLLNTGALLPNGNRHKIAAYVEIDPRNTDDVKRAIAECGVAYLGISIPEAWCSMPVGEDWTDASGPIGGGHAIIAGGYDDDWLYVVSWGSVWRMSWEAFAKVTNETYMMADSYWINAKGVSPFGQTLVSLESSMQGLKAN